jgi:hypothetical protein
VIANASDRIDAALGATDGDDAVEMDRRRHTCVLLVMKNLYLDAWRQDRDDVWKAKLGMVTEELAPLMEAEADETAEGASLGFAVERVRRPVRPNPVLRAFGVSRVRRYWWP